jgi:ABC-2 type transport system ATP-binding protein
MSQYVIETTDLTKNYGKKIAVDKLNLRIEEGEIYGFLGPNGAGKTTTILMLMGLTEPTSGTIKVCGYSPNRDPLKIKHLVSYLPEKVGFYDDLTAGENLEYTAQLNGALLKELPHKVAEALNSVGLSDMTDKKVGEFSHGMKQRLGIADVMIKNPKVIIFDEPTSGIDPQGVDEVLNLIRKLGERKITALISSHQLHHIQAVCSTVGILSEGTMVAEGPISTLGKEAIAGGKYQIEVQASPIDHKLIKAIESIKGVINLETKSHDTMIVTSDDDLRHQISKVVVDSGSLLTGIKIEEYSLEEIYLKYFKEQ